MRATGWCERCRRVRNIRVNLARTVGRRAATGICFDCEDAAHADKMSRRRSY